MVKAKYWEKLDGKKVKCTLCPHSCVIPEGSKGICNIRENIDGKLIAAGYGRTTSLAMDPIEKKPLFHFKPGSLILSVAPNGCNLKCRWCQNWQISQEVVPTRFIDPKLLVDRQKHCRANRNRHHKPKATRSHPHPQHHASNRA